jgi:aerobic-type carbon monoxide dehydrogenase small subunit (CoxS/CutS family)
MSSPLSVTVNGAPVVVPSGATVAVAMAIAGHACRTSVSGESRGPLCGMGICFECRVAINGKPHRPGCQILCEHGMDVRTDE